MKVIGLTRVRNESLIIRDSITQMLRICDEVVVLDDASTDSTPEIVRGMALRPVHLIQNSEWAADRQAAETADRARLLAEAKKRAADWVVYLDADERVVGDLRALLRGCLPVVDGIRLRLFDAYLTPELHAPYAGGELVALPRLFGPEYRSILIAWRAQRGFAYVGRDQREPVASLCARTMEADLPILHYGKAISIRQWEETCAYYAQHFPEPYASKWASRRGRPLHDASSFGRRLVPWPVSSESQVNVGDEGRNWRFRLRQFQVTIRSFPAVIKRRSGCVG